MGAADLEGGAEGAKAGMVVRVGLGLGLSLLLEWWAVVGPLLSVLTGFLYLCYAPLFLRGQFRLPLVLLLSRTSMYAGFRSTGAALFVLSFCGLEPFF